MTAPCFYVGGRRLGLMLGVVNGNWTGPKWVTGTWAEFRGRAGADSVQQDDGRLLGGP